MSTPKTELIRRVRDLKAYVEELLDRGETAWLCPAAPKAAVQVQAAPVRPARPAGLARSVPDTPLAALAQDVAECRQCPLEKNRTQAVFGEGNPAAQLVFIGEAPGAEEDRQGRPFVGEAGKLLTKIIESIGLTREGVYICNVLKCRPPGNRNPSPEEIAACRPHLEKQLSLLQPKLICALGTFAAQALLDTQEPIGRLRGRRFEYRGIPVIPTFHPAALLYHPQNKRPVWEDMKQIAKLLSINAGAKRETGVE